MVFRILLITISGLAFGMNQDLEMQAVQMLETDVPLFEVPIQRELSPVELSILNATSNIYPHSFIEQSYKLLSSDHKSMARLLPQIESLRTGRTSCKWSMDQTFYALTSYQILYITGMLAWAWATHQDPAVISLGLVYEAVLVGAVLAKYFSVYQRENLLAQHIELVKSCTEALQEANQTRVEYESTLENTINQALTRYQCDIIMAQIHRKLLAHDGFSPLHELEQQCNDFLEKLAYLRNDQNNAAHLLSTKQKEILYNAVKTCNPSVLHELLKDCAQNNSEELAAELGRTIYQNPQRLQTCCYTRSFKHGISYFARLLLSLVFFIDANVNQTVYHYKTYEQDILPFLMIGSVPSLLLEMFGIMFSTGDSLDAKEDKHLLAMYQLYAKTLSTIASQKRCLSKTLSHKRSQALVDSCEYEKQHALLEDMLNTIKKDHAHLLARIAD